MELHEIHLRKIRNFVAPFANATDDEADRVSPPAPHMDGVELRNDALEILEMLTPADYVEPE